MKPPPESPFTGMYDSRPTVPADTPARPATAALPWGPLWPGFSRPAGYVIVAIDTWPDGEERWDFDSAATFEAAFDKLRLWNARAAAEWPGMRFIMKSADADGVP